MSATASSAKSFTGRHVIYCLLGFFGVIIVVNAIFLTHALRTFPGESMKKSYLQGLHYNEVLADRAEQAALGWRAEIVGVNAGNGDGVIELRLLDEVDRPLRGLTVSGELRRLVHSRDDRNLTFTATNDGLYRASAGVLEVGVWSLIAQAEDDAGHVFDFTAKVEVR